MEDFMRDTSEIIISRLTSNSVLYCLYSKQVITHEEYEDIKSLHNANNRRKLVAALRIKDISCLDKFISTVESKTVGQDDMVETLKSARENLSLKVIRTDVKQTDGIWFGDLTVPWNFTGRTNELQELHEIVLKSHNSPENVDPIALLCIVYGLTGMGKSTLARQYAFVNRNFFDDNVILLRSESPKHLEDDYRTLAKNYLKIYEAESKNLVLLVRDVYQSLKDKRSLFIFDNVQDEIHIRPFLPNNLPPSAQRPYLLATSKIKDFFVNGNNVFMLDGLDKNEALKLIENSLPTSTHQERKRLSAAIGYSPLTLQQAIAYIRHRTSSNSITTYLQDFEEKYITPVYNNLCGKNLDLNESSISKSLRQFEDDDLVNQAAEALEVLKFQMEQTEEKFMVDLLNEQLKNESENDTSNAIAKLQKQMADQKKYKYNTGRNIFQDYRTKLERFKENNANDKLSLEKLAALHKITNQSIITDLVTKSSNNELGFDLTGKFKIQSLEAFDEIFRELEEKLNDKQRAADVKIANELIQTYVRKYQDIIKNAQWKDLNELKIITTKEGQLIQEFRNECPNISHALFNKFIEKLQAEFSNTFSKEFLQIQNKLKIKDEQEESRSTIKIEQDKVLLNTTILESMQSYEHEMEEHFRNTNFLAPITFRLYHESLVDRILKQYKQKLSSEKKEELQEHLTRMYSKYNEINTMNTPVNDVAIGIDISTTYSCAAFYHNGEVRIIPSESDTKMLTQKTPMQTIHDTHSIIEQTMNDKEGRLKHIKKMADKYFQGKEVKKAVITLPYYFNDAQQKAIICAAELAGLEILCITNKPAAAVTAYNLHYPSSSILDEKTKSVLVYDLGCQALFVSVLSVGNEQIKFLSANANTRLSGEMIDNNLVKFCIQLFKQQTGMDLFVGNGITEEKKVAKTEKLLCRLRAECEKRKKSLSFTESTTINLKVVADGRDLNIPITRKQFEDINKSLFEETIDFVKEEIVHAKLRSDQIDEIVLVGGSSKIPKIHELLKDFFGGKELKSQIDPVGVVARGAAMLAARLNGEEEQKRRKYI